MISGPIRTIGFNKIILVNFPLNNGLESVSCFRAKENTVKGTVLHRLVLNHGEFSYQFWWSLSYMKPNLHYLLTAPPK